MHTGHSDVIMGVVCTNSDELGKKLRFQQMGAQSLLSYCPFFLTANFLGAGATHHSISWRSSPQSIRMLPSQPWSEDPPPQDEGAPEERLCCGQVPAGLPPRH